MNELDRMKKLAGIQLNENSESEFRTSDESGPSFEDNEAPDLEYVKGLVQQLMDQGDNINRALGQVSSFLDGEGYNTNQVNHVITRVGTMLNDTEFPYTSSEENFPTDGSDAFDNYNEIDEAREPIYYSVFSTDGSKWSHYFDAESEDDAKDEARSLRNAGLKVKIFTVPQSEADWSRVDPNEFVMARLAKIANPIKEEYEERDESLYNEIKERFDRLMYSGEDIDEVYTILGRNLRQEGNSPYAVDLYLNEIMASHMAGEDAEDAAAQDAMNPTGGNPEFKMDEKAPPDEEGLVRKLKKEYPSDEGRAFSTAWSIYDKKHGKKPVSEDNLDDEITDKQVMDAYDARHGAFANNLSNKYDLADRASMMANKYAQQQAKKNNGTGFDPITGRSLPTELGEHYDDEEDNRENELYDRFQEAAARLTVLDDGIMDLEQAISIIVGELNNEGYEPKEIERFVKGLEDIANGSTDEPCNGEFNPGEGHEANEFTADDTQRNNGFDVDEENNMGDDSIPEEIELGDNEADAPGWFIARHADDRIAAGPFESRQEAMSNMKNYEWYSKAPANYFVDFGVDDDGMFVEDNLDEKIELGDENEGTPGFYALSRQSDNIMSGPFKTKKEAQNYLYWNALQGYVRYGYDMGDYKLEPEMDAPDHDFNEEQGNNMITKEEGNNAFTVGAFVEKRWSRNGPTLTVVKTLENDEVVVEDEEGHRGIMHTKDLVPSQIDMTPQHEFDTYNGSDEIEEDFDLNNGYDEQHYADKDDYFPNGNDGPIVKSTGAAGARQGDNPEAKKMEITEAHKELVYKYRRFVKETVDVTDFNPKSQGGTRKELLAKYKKSKSSDDASAARKAGATQTELKDAKESK
jgi:hypothetical protein